MIAIELVVIIAACTFLAGYAANYALNYMKTHPKVEETASPLEIEEVRLQTAHRDAEEATDLC